MTEPFFINTDEFKERTIVRRVFLDGNTSREALLLFTKLVEDFPSIHLRLGIQQLCGLSIHCNSYHFGFGYVFEVSLTQTKSDNFTFLLVNPYKEAQKAMNQIFSEGYVYTEKNLVLCKERLLLENEILLRSSKTVMESNQSCLYAPILVDEIRMKEMKKEDVDNILAQVRGSKVGDIILLGRKEKNELPSPYSESLPALNSVSTGSCVIKNMDDESLGLRFSHKGLSKTSDLKLLEGAMSCLEASFDKYISRLLSVDYSVSFSQIDSNHFLFTITLKPGKMGSLMKLFTTTDGKLPFAIEANYEEAISFYKMSEISLHMDSANFLKKEILMHDMKLEQDDGTTFSREKLCEMISSFQFEDRFIVGEEMKND